MFKKILNIFKKKKSKDITIKASILDINLNLNGRNNRVKRKL